MMVEQVLDLLPERGVYKAGMFTRVHGVTMTDLAEVGDVSTTTLS